jgi:hypothetical protein
MERPASLRQPHRENEVGSGARENARLVVDVKAANERAIARVLACKPRLVAVKAALEVVPGMRPELILHAAPPARFGQLSPPLQAGIAGAPMDCFEQAAQAVLERSR